MKIWNKSQFFIKAGKPFGIKKTAPSIKFLNEPCKLSKTKLLKPSSFFINSGNILSKPLTSVKQYKVSFVLKLLQNANNFEYYRSTFTKLKTNLGMTYKPTISFTSKFSKDVNFSTTNFYITPFSSKALKLFKPTSFDSVNQEYWNLVQYLTNICTLKSRNSTKISLTRVNVNSFLRNSSFFSDMNSWQFTKIKQHKLELMHPLKRNYDVITGLETVSRLLQPNFTTNLMQFNRYLSSLKSNSLRTISWSNYIKKGIKPKLYKTLKSINSRFRHLLILRRRAFMNRPSRRYSRDLSLVNFYSQQEKNLLKRKLSNFTFKSKYLNLKKLKSKNLTQTYYNSTYHTRKLPPKNNNQPTITSYRVKGLAGSKILDTSLYEYLLTVSNPLLLKLRCKSLDTTKNISNIVNPTKSGSGLLRLTSPNLNSNNLLPNKSFRKVITKQAFDFFSSYKFYENIIPWYHNTLIRFFEHISGLKSMLQIYPFINQNINYSWIIRYRSWMPRMAFYERMLGHKFFLEEALHIIHLSFYYKDSKLFSSWLKAIILRISFWKTRSIFRFLKYLMINHFYYVFNELGIKGLKIKLKGKISVAGNSRKRSILYRVGKTSYSQVSLRVSHHKTTINTFTGVMGFQVWLFY